MNQKEVWAKKRKVDQEQIESAYAVLQPQEGKPLFTGCQRCDAKCCNKSSPVMLPDVERDFLRKKLRMEGKLDYRFHLFGYQTLGEPCVYLTQDNRCEIYDDRPLDCRVYPVLVEYRGQGMLMKRAPLCPFSDELYESDFERARVAERIMFPLFSEEYKQRYSNAGGEHVLPETTQTAQELIQLT